jgi:hypothetical protein
MPGLYISCFNHINPTLLLIPYPHGPLIFSSLQYCTLYYIHTEMVCSNIFHSLIFSFRPPPLMVPLVRLTIVILFSMSLYMYIYIFNL